MWQNWQNYYPYILFNFHLANVTNLTQSCVDINECLIQPPVCSLNQNCTNTIGSYFCSCKTGYIPDVVNNTCIDINECVETPGICESNATCINTMGSYKCICNFNYDKVNDTCLYEIRCIWFLSVF